MKKKAKAPVAAPVEEPTSGPGGSDSANVQKESTSESPSTDWAKSPAVQSILKLARIGIPMDRAEPAREEPWPAGEGVPEDESDLLRWLTEPAALASEAESYQRLKAAAPLLQRLHRRLNSIHIEYSFVERRQLTADELIEAFGDSDIEKIDGYDDCVAGVVIRSGQKPTLCYDGVKVIQKKLANEEVETMRPVAELFESELYKSCIGTGSPFFLLRWPDPHWTRG